MKAGRELILLTSILFILLINLSGSDDSLPFSFSSRNFPLKSDYVEVVMEGRARLLPSREVQKHFILKNGGTIEKGDSFHITETGISRSRMKGGTLILLGLPMNVNAASAEDLTAISGIGPKTAEAIVSYRSRKGPFKRLTDLIKVKGIGKKRLARMRQFLTI